VWRRGGIRGCGYLGQQDGLLEIIVAKTLINIFHKGLKDRDEPLRDNINTLFSVQAPHVGLCTFRKVSFVVEDN